MAARTFDYIRQFWQENEAQVFSARETQLYFFLLAECNRQYWRNPFGCATQRITNNLDISRQTLCRLRKKLEEHGLISYQEGKNHSSTPDYSLLIKKTSGAAQVKTSSNGIQNGTQDGTANVTQNGTQNGTNIKTYLKDNISNFNKEELIPLDELQGVLSGNKEWLGGVSEYIHGQGIDMSDSEVGEQLRAFFLYLHTGGTISKSITDAQSHFVNWLVKRERGRTGMQKQPTARQVGVKLTDNSPEKFKNITGW